MDEEIKQIQLDILNELRALRDQGTGSSLGGGRKITKDPAKVIEDATDAVDEFGDELVILGVSTKNLNRAQIDQLKAAEEYKKNLETQSDALKKGTDSVKEFGKALLDTQRNFGKYGKALEGITAETGKFLSTLGPLGKAVGGTVAVLGKLGTVYMEQADRLLKANDQLAQFGTAGSFTTKELMQMAHGAGVTSKNMELFTKPLTSLGPALINIGKNTGDSVKAFADLTKISNQQREEFQRLGISQEQLIQTQADYVALQAMSGRNLKAEMKDRAALQRASLEYQDTLLELSSLTGQDVEAIKKKQQEAQRAVEWQISQIQLENKARKLEAEGRTEEAKKLRDEAKARVDSLNRIAALGNETVTKGARQFLSTGTIAGEEAQALTRMGLMEDLQELRKAIKSGANVQEATAKFQDAYNKKFGQTIDNVGFAAQHSKDVARQFGIDAQSLENFNRQRDQNFKEETKSAQERIAEGKKTGKDPAQDARAKLTTVEIEAGKAIDKLVAATNPLVSGFNAVTIAGTAAAAALGALALGAGGSVLKSMGDAGKAAADAAKKAASTRLPGTGGTVAPGTGAPKVPPVPVPSGGAPKVPPLPGKGAPGLPGGVAGAAGPGKIATGVENLIGALGKGAGTALEGAAKGLQAFANPKVALGAAGLGASITAIGAGIAGATWLMGKSLPTFAKGIEPFEKLDGDKLSKTGKGIAALGGGLAVFSAGGVAAGVGSILGGVSEGIASLFGAKTPFEKLEEFSRLNIDADKVKNNAEAMVAFNKAMAWYGGASVVSSLGTALSSLSDSLGSFFKVKPPVEKLIEFGNITIDKDKVAANAEAFVAFSDAFSSYSGMSTTGAISGVVESITSFFGADNDAAFKKFEKFSNLDIKDPDRVKKNAEAFVAFANALSQYKGGGQLQNISDNLIGGINKLFGGQNATDKFVQFSKLQIDPERTEKLAQAFVKYAQSIGIMSGQIKSITLAPTSGAAKVDTAIQKTKFEPKHSKEVQKQFGFDDREEGTPIKINGKIAGKMTDSGIVAAPGQADAIRKAQEDLRKQLGAQVKTTSYREETTFDAAKFKEKDPEGHAQYIERIRQLERAKLEKIEETNPRNRIRKEFVGAEAQREASKEFFERAQKVGAATKTVSGTPPGIPPTINVKVDKPTTAASPFTMQRGIPEATSESGDMENPYGNLLQASDQLTDTFIRLSRLIDTSAKDLTQLSDTFGRLDTNLKQNLTRSIPTEFGDAMGSLAKSIPVRVDRSMEDLDEAMGESFGGATKVRDSLKAGIADAAKLRRELRGEEEPSGIGAAPAAPAIAPPRPMPAPPVAPPMPAPVPAVPARPPEVKQEAKQNLADLKSVLMAKGEKDENYINAVLANVMKESGGVSKEEDLDYSKTSNERIRSVFGSRAAGMSDQQLNQIKSNKQSMAEFMYGGGTEIGRRMGNTEAGDGWKYRGRGYIQLTGKSNYAQASKAIFGDDRLVKDPDLVNNPKIAAEVTAWYMQKTKGSMMRSLGVGAGPMSREQANQLATSQVAGRAIQRGEQGYLASTLAKVDQYSTQVAGVQASPATAGGTAVAAAPSPSGGGILASIGSFFGIGGKQESKPLSGSHEGESPARSTATDVQVASAKDAKNPKDQVEKAGLKVRPYGDVYQGGLLTETTLSAARQAQDLVPGFGMFTGLNDVFHKEKHPRSKHAIGQGVDFTLSKMPTIDESKEIKAMLQKIPGVSYVANEYYGPPHGEKNAKTTGPHFHFQTSAAEGAVIDGPEAGYPVDLTAHGREIIAPLQPNSILEMLSKTTVSQSNVEPVKPAIETADPNNEAIRSLMSMNEEMISVLSSKMDLMINELSRSNSTQDKLLQTARV